MDDPRAELLSRLEAQYRDFGWSVERAADGTIRAIGPGGVTWIGAAVVREDIESGELAARLPQLSRQRMSDSGELCPLDLLPEPECEAATRTLLERLGLSRCPHISVYSLAAA